MEDVPDRIGHNSVAGLSDAVKQTHAVGFACSRIAIDEDQAVIGRVLLLGFNEDVIDDVLAAHLEHLLGCFIALKHVIEFVYLILGGRLNLYLLFAQILNLLILL